jgi:RNA polymerase sigma-70 factor (ECF subfamily)
MILQGRAGELLSRLRRRCGVCLGEMNVMSSAADDTDELLRRAGTGDRSARGELLQRYRDRLRRMVAFRIDPRLTARVDPSDVVQEALGEADRRLDEYLRRRPLPFYPWLRQLAWDRLVEQHRRHLHAGRRSVRREEVKPPALSGASALELADRLVDSGQAPSAEVQREELRKRVRVVLEDMGEADREVLVLRYLEQLSASEVGTVLGVTEAAAKKRALRALRRLRDALMSDMPGGNS